MRRARRWSSNKRATAASAACRSKISNRPITAALGAGAPAAAVPGNAEGRTFPSGLLLKNLTLREVGLPDIDDGFTRRLVREDVAGDRSVEQVGVAAARER